MNKLKNFLLSITLVLSLFAQSAFALIPAQVNQGGTGVNTITGIIQGNGISPFSPVTIGTGLTYSAGTLSASGSGSGITGVGTVGVMPVIDTVDGSNNILTLVDSHIFSDTHSLSGTIDNDDFAQINFGVSDTLGSFATGIQFQPTLAQINFTSGTGGSNLSLHDDGIYAVATDGIPLGGAGYLAVDTTGKITAVSGLSGITGVGTVNYFPRVATVDGSNNILTVQDGSAYETDNYYVAYKTDALDTTAGVDIGAGITGIGGQFVVQADAFAGVFRNQLFFSDAGTGSSYIEQRGDGMELRLYDTFSVDYSSVKLKQTDLTITSPNIVTGTIAQLIDDGTGDIAIRSLADGTSGQVLSTDGAGTYSWVTAGGGSGTVNSGTQYQMTFYAGTGTTVSGNTGITTDAINNFALAPTATTGAPNSGFNYTSPAHTALTASTEWISEKHNLSATIQYATGALTTHRGAYYQGQTISAVGASTITDAITMQIDGPTAGTNTTITNPYALFINSLNWKYGSGVTGLRFRDNTSSGLFAAAYSTNVTPSNTNHFWMHNGITTHINATSAGSILLTNNGTSILSIGSASVVASKLMTVTDTVAGTALDVLNSTTSAAANGLKVTMSSAGHNAAQGIIVSKSTTSGGGNVLTMLDFQQNGQNATTSQEILHTYSLRDNSSSRSAGAIAFKYSNTGSGTQVTGWTWRNLVGGTTLTNTLQLDGSDLKLLVAGGGLYVKEGTNATMGTCTLVAGTCTVSTTKVTANSRIFITRQTTAGTLGTSVDVTARTAGTSFTITSNGSVLDTSVVAWMIVEPS